MRKSLKIFALALAAVALVGCNSRGGGDTTGGGQTSGGQTTSYGSEVEKAAIDRVMGGNVAAVNNETAIIAGQVSQLDADNNDNVTVITKQLVNVNGTKVEVHVDWTYEDNSVVDLFHTLEGQEEYNKVFEFNYPAKGGEAVEFKFKGTAKCGATTADPVEFAVSLQPTKYVYPDYRLAEILKVKSDGSCFEHVTDAAKGYWESNNQDADTPYMYITTFGKVVYLSPDGNWGLIAEGDLFLEIYAGSGRKLGSKYYPGLAVGNWVSVRGEPSNYKGNVQLGYISKVKQVEKGSMAEPNMNYRTVDEAYLTGYNQFNGDMNALFSVTGVYAGNAKPAVDSMNVGARATFDLTVGSKTFTIAYDYHTCKDSDVTLFDEMVAVLKGATAGSTRLTIKGTLRFVANGSNAFTNDGTCQLTPFLAGHVVAA